MLLPRAWICAVACIALLSLVACGPTGPSTTPTTSAPPAATSAPSSAAASPVASVSARPSVAPSAAPAIASASASPAASPSSGAVSAARSGATRLTLDPAGTSASYHAREQLAGRTLFSDAVGTSKNVTGQVVVGAAGEVVPDQSQVVVDLTMLQSDESRRDNFIKGNTLQVSQFPRATFVPQSIDGLPSPMPSSGDADFTVAGDLTVHGVTKPVTWQVTGHFSGSNVSGTATTNVNMTDFGMTPPRAGPVLAIEDGLGLQIDFAAHSDS